MLENNTLILNEHATEATIIWLHGLGASPDDFVFLASLFPSYRWILPHAPFRTVSIYQETVTAWYDIKSLDKKDDPRETGIFDTHRYMESYLSSNNATPIFIGGFSQGGAQALFSGLNSQTVIPKGIITMSGYCPYLFNQSSAPPTLIMHGMFDEVIPWTLAEFSYDEILKLPSTTCHTLSCGHEWHPDMQLMISAFLKTCLNS